MQLSGGKNSGPLLMTALLLALLFAVYYYAVLPKQEKVTEKESVVNSLTSEISTMRDQIALIEDEKNGEINSEFTMRKKLPASKEIDQLLLSLEEAEYISGSRILGISFNNYDSIVSESGLTNPNTPAEEGVEDGTPEENGDNKKTSNVTDGSAPGSPKQSEETIPVSTMSAEALPANLKLITFQIDIESPDDEQLQQFLKEIEGLERVMHIDTIEYSLPGEEDALLDDASKVVSASIQVTIFYFE